MNIEIKKQIINLVKFIFEDEDYTRAISYLERSDLNNLRLFIDEKYELLSIVSMLNPLDEVINYQLVLCDKLEDVVINAYLEIE